LLCGFSPVFWVVATGSSCCTVGVVVDADWTVTVTSSLRVNSPSLAVSRRT
jgi:hypothetical protein